MKIGIVDVFVDGQDRAREFYTAMLGLEVKVDAAYGENGRWLTVVSPQDRDGTALLLAPLLDAAKALQAARRESGTPGCVLHHRGLRAQLPGAGRARCHVRVRASTDGLRGNRRRVRGRLRQPAQPAPGHPRRNWRLSPANERTRPSCPTR
jgi:catechol 2,3-dioxygenase-like lactoylglutathione lyase family enzyme